MHHGAQLANQVVELLPTPVAHDDQKSPEAHAAMKRRMPGGERQTITSLTVLAKHEVEKGPLLPTPTAADHKGSRNSTADVREDSTGSVGDTLTDAAWILDGIGARTRRRSTGGRPSSADQHPTLFEAGS